ncbi:MAG: DUF4230 domain-containing protein [Myxococcales bacterium]|nr:DUF4230 domain-containing protein [Myxococcales bacterium]
MTDVSKAKPTWRARLRRVALLVLLLFAAATGAAILWGYQRVSQWFGPDDTLTVHPGASVIVAVHKLSRLESAQFNIERVVDLTDKQRALFGLLEVTDKILLVAAGEVTAGIDLQELKAEDVVVDMDRQEATLTLPPARIFSVRVDNERTYVHHRETDLLANRKDTLEAKARQEAERSIRQAALDGGILEHARRNAARTVESLLNSLGYTAVTVRWGDA